MRGGERGGVMWREGEERGGEGDSLPDQRIYHPSQFCGDL